MTGSIENIKLGLYKDSLKFLSTLFNKYLVQYLKLTQDQYYKSVIHLVIYFFPKVKNHDILSLISFFFSY